MMPPLLAQVNKELSGNWDCPEALLTNELASDLGKLQAGGEAILPKYDFSTSTRTLLNAGGSGSCTRQGQVSVKHGGVILVEGAMVLESAPLRKILDLRVFVDCDEDVRFMRRLARDTDPEGRGGRGRSAASVSSFHTSTRVWQFR